MKFAAYMNKFMEYLGLSQRAMSRVIGMSNQTVSLYIRGKQVVPATTRHAIVYRLCRELDHRIIETQMRIEALRSDIVELEALKEEASKLLQESDSETPEVSE